MWVVCAALPVSPAHCLWEKRDAKEENKSSFASLQRKEPLRLYRHSGSLRHYNVSVDRSRKRDRDDDVPPKGSNNDDFNTAIVYFKSYLLVNTKNGIFCENLCIFIYYSNFGTIYRSDRYRCDSILCAHYCQKARNDKDFMLKLGLPLLTAFQVEMQSFHGGRFSD